MHSHYCLKDTPDQTIQNVIFALEASFSLAQFFNTPKLSHSSMPIRASVIGSGVYSKFFYTQLKKKSGIKTWNN